uniref:DUF4773 domain-containing protein n=1 Tax=Magallana gigas TaxID=29159 RepID=A0A8W8MG74_MAGGI
MVAMFHLVGMITFWSLLQAGSARTDFPQMNDAELENFVQLEGSFNCKGTSCQCCVNVGLDFVSDSLEACINVKKYTANKSRLETHHPSAQPRHF